MKDWFWIVVVFFAALTAHAEHADNARAEAPAGKTNPVLEQLGIERIAAGEASRKVIYSTAVQECGSKGMTLASERDLEALAPHLPALLGNDFDVNSGWLWSATPSADPKYEHRMYSFDVKTTALAKHRASGRILCVKYKADRVPGELGLVVALVGELNQVYARVKQERLGAFDSYDGKTIRSFRKRGAYPSLPYDVRESIYAGWMRSVSRTPDQKKQEEESGPSFIFGANGGVYTKVGGSLITPSGKTLTGVGGYYFDDKGRTYYQLGGMLHKY
jgi:hypothetical protein